MVCSLAIVGGMLAGASWYGHWLSTDRLAWEGPADSVVTLSGDSQIPHAALWLKQGRVREVWVIRTRGTLLVELGIHEHFADASLRELRDRGVLDSQVRVLAVAAEESEIPRLLLAIGQAPEFQGAQQVVMACQPLEARFLRQIADAALPRPQADRLRFVTLPHDEYTSTRWWVCRTGWKSVYVASLQILANATFGPLSGFDSVPWSPDAWEAQTFPQVPQVSR